MGGRAALVRSRWEKRSPALSPEEKANSSEGRQPVISRLFPSSHTVYVTSAGRQPARGQSEQFLFSFSLSRPGRRLGGEEVAGASSSVTALAPRLEGTGALLWELGGLEGCIIQNITGAPEIPTIDAIQDKMQMYWGHDK